MAKKSKKKVLPISESAAEEKKAEKPISLDCDVLDIPKPAQVKKALPMIVNTKQLLQTKLPPTQSQI